MMAAPPASLPSQAADACVAAMNAEPGWSQPFTAVRAYLPERRLETLDTLRVTVIPRARSDAVLSRRDVLTDVQVDVAVQRRVDPTDVAAVDALAQLVEEIADFWKFRRLPVGETIWAWTKTESSPIYDPDHLSQMQLFTAVATITLRRLT